MKTPGRLAAVILILVAGDNAKAAEPPPQQQQQQTQTPEAVLTACQQRLELAESLTRKQQPAAALYLLRVAMDDLRQAVNVPIEKRNAWAARLQDVMIATVRAEERHLDLLEEAHRRQEQAADRQEILDNLAPTQLRTDDRIRQFDRIMAQFGGGGGGGGGGIGGGVGVGGGTFGFGPTVSSIPQGATLNVAAVVSADRRYVRIGVNPLFISNVGFDSYNIFGAAGGS